MAEEFEDRDLSESVFWGVRLNRATFRDADLSGSTFFHTLWSGVSIDGVVDGLVVNGVDVTEYVNAHDRWYPLRTRLEPATADGVRESWSTIRQEWATLIDAVVALGPDALIRSVGGEWSLRDTLRHLVFAIEKWFTWPLLGERSFSALGLPNTGSQGHEWPGIDLGTEPTWDEAVAAFGQRVEQFTEFVASLDVDSLPEAVEVLENGEVPALMCLHVVLEETFEHLRYALRDVAVIAAE